jgi:hypothetical protein
MSVLFLLVTEWVSRNILQDFTPMDQNSVNPWMVVLTDAL